MSSLRLGPVLAEKPVKIALELPGKLLRDLDDYARVHAEANGLGKPLSTEILIPAMIERFIATDRGFGKARRALQEK